MISQKKIVLIPLLLLLLGSSAKAVELCVEAEWARTITAPVAVLSGEEKAPLLNGLPLPQGTAPELISGGLAEASGTSCLTIPRGAGKPPAVKGEAEILLPITQPGEYILWARVWWFDRCGNSVTMLFNGGKPFLLGQNATYKTWHWVRVKTLTFPLTAGDQLLTIQNHEDGIKIDQILLTRNSRYIPVGVEETTIPAPIPAGTSGQEGKTGEKN